MENARKHYGLSEKSPLLSVPATLRPRCNRSACSGHECLSWRFCGPSSPFGTYFSHLPHTFVSQSQGEATTPSISA